MQFIGRNAPATARTFGAVSALNRFKLPNYKKGTTAMNPHAKALSSSILAAALIVGAGVPAYGQAPMPEQKMQNSVAYLNGGAGDEEVQFIKQSIKGYSMALAFARSASPRAEYVADVAVTVKDAKGQTVFDLPSSGPYLLLKLPAGSYQVTAIYQGKTQTRTVSSRNAPSLVTFQWR